MEVDTTLSLAQTTLHSRLDTILADRQPTLLMLIRPTDLLEERTWYTPNQEAKSDNTSCILVITGKYQSKVND